MDNRIFPGFRLRAKKLPNSERSPEETGPLTPDDDALGCFAVTITPARCRVVAGGLAWGRSGSEEDIEYFRVFRCPRHSQQISRER